jgi:hypothetical protein
MASDNYDRPPRETDTLAEYSESTVSVASDPNEGKDGEVPPQFEESGQREAISDPEKAGNQVNVNPSPPTMSPPPDGGLEAWSVVAGGFCVLFVSFGWINCTFSIPPDRDMSGQQRKYLRIGRHWRVPGLLSDSSIEELLFQHRGMDSVY